MHTTHHRTTAWLCLALIVGTATGAAGAEPAAISYNRDVRPIISDNCSKCHGFDSATREAGLRLDVREAAIAPLGKGGRRAIVPGDAAASQMIKRITHADPDERMPPIDTGKKLTAKQIETLRRWIDAGAEYEPHWSFISPVRPEPPNVKSEKWVRNPIDRFVLARLEREGVEPSPEADRVTLIRRVTLDLTGLPPTPAEVDAFVADTSAEAYEKVVDRLLASPRYGERMAQVWLDIARYADTHGYQADWERTQWRWRTWVIDAYNRNLPYDAFTVEQLAGDLLPNATTEQVIATGFNRNHRINDEGGIIPQEFLVEYIVDRVETASTAWLGLTTGCARCHDHKFDPITQREFYQLFAFFYNVPEKGKDGRQGYADPTIRVAISGRQGEYDELRQAKADAEANVAKLRQTLGKDQAAWEQATLAGSDRDGGGWDVIKPTSVEATGGVSFTAQDDYSVLASGDNADKPVYSVVIAPGDRKVTALRLETLTDPSLGKGSVGIGPGGNFVLTGFGVTLTRDGKERPVKIASATADYEQKGWPIGAALDGDAATGWAVDGHVHARPHAAAFTLDAPLTTKGGDTLTVELRHESRYSKHAIGRLRLSLTDDAKPTLNGVGKGESELANLLRTPAAQRKPAQAARLFEMRLATLPQGKAAMAAREEVDESLKAFEKQYTTLVMVMKEMDAPRQAFVLKRGVYDAPGEKVGPGTPAVLPPLAADAAPNRLTLARWLVSGEHPLTARVAVNRYWSMLLGVGIVKTEVDFGTQGEWPSHPELLDWLATEYVRLGWDTKAMLRQMVTSATYRQASAVRPELLERDPENRLLARMSRVRLAAESIRDSMLYAAGLLVEKIGGPSVKTYQPAGLWEELSFQDKNRTTDFYVQATGQDLYRRSVYTFWKRTVPPPSMATFDAPSRETCVVVRSRTNTPLQAMALMNDVIYVEAARTLAAHAMSEGEQRPESRIRWMFRQILGREPDAKELATLRRGYEQRRATFAARPADAAALLEEGDSPAPAELDPVDLAAYATVAMTIINLDEAINRE